MNDNKTKLQKDNPAEDKIVVLTKSGADACDDKTRVLAV